MHYLVKVKYDRTGETKPVKEQYLFETDSFASADFAAHQAIQPFASSDVEILAITRMNIAEVIGDAFGLESEAQAMAAQIMGKREISNAPDTWFTPTTWMVRTTWRIWNCAKAWRIIPSNP